MGLFAEPKVVLWKQVQKYVAHALTRPCGNVADKQAPSYLTALGHMDCMLRVALVAVCEGDENQYLAANFLTHYAAMLVEQFKSPSILAKPKEVQNTQLDTAMNLATVHTLTPPCVSCLQLLNRPEEMLMLLHTYLPNGQLLFTSDLYAKHLRREFDESLLA